jgi:hypothetical protein
MLKFLKECLKIYFKWLIAQSLLSLLIIIIIIIWLFFR